MSSKALVPILIGVVACCCLSSMVGGGLWAGNVFCDKTNPDDQVVGMDCPSVYERSSTSSTPTDPRATVWASGQKIQGDPLEVATSLTAVIPFTTFPQPATGAPNYTMSIDINVAQASAIWRAIMGNSPSYNLVRQPWVNVFPSTGAEPLRLEGGHTAAGGGDQISIPVAAGFGTWFNLTFTVNSTAYTSYINGIQVAQYTYTSAEGPPTWPSGTQKWNWSWPGVGPSTNSSSIKVANTYFWPSVLTATEIAKLKIPTSPTPGVATTSYYMPEPFDDAKEISELNI